MNYRQQLALKTAKRITELQLTFGEAYGEILSTLEKVVLTTRAEEEQRRKKIHKELCDALAESARLRLAQQPKASPWTLESVKRLYWKSGLGGIADAHNATLVTTTEYAKGWDDHVAAVKAGIGAEQLYRMMPEGTEIQDGDIPLWHHGSGMTYHRIMRAVGADAGERDTKRLDWLEENCPSVLPIINFAPTKRGEKDVVLGHHWEINDNIAASTLREAIDAAIEVKP